MVRLRARPESRGKPRVLVSRTFDRAFSEAGRETAELDAIANALDQALKGLAGAAASGSVIFAAVADRALHLETFTYGDVADDDLALFIETRCDWERSAAEDARRYLCLAWEPPRDKYNPTA